MKKIFLPLFLVATLLSPFSVHATTNTDATEVNDDGKNEEENKDKDKDKKDKEGK